MDNYYFSTSLKMGLLFVLFWVCTFRLFSQDAPRPTAWFSFNGGVQKDEVSGKPVRAIGVQRCEDRFGNKNNALFLFGSEGSYINLGSGNEVKPEIGSISLWVNIEDEIWSGTGYTINPIILTKRTHKDDFFESFIICYHPAQQTFAAWSSKDSTKQISVSSTEKVKLMKWYHLAITYDDEHFAFYVNGELQASLNKDYRTHYIKEDSVLLGITANKKNNRYFHGSIDDIKFYDRVLNDEQVLLLFHEPNPNQKVIVLNWCLRIFLLLLLVYCVYRLFRWRLRRQLEREREKQLLNTRLLETELRVNRALMNPHFIFNSLSSIQNLILNKRNDDANLYLLKFSKLMRKILESNTSDSISLTDEIDMLQRYLEIEQMRFEEKFNYTISVHPELKQSQIRIPIMMIQPFVENSIWHGLITKEGERVLLIKFEPFDTTYVSCHVDDNGLGRQERDHVLQEKKSMATIFVRSRLELFNKIYNLKCDLCILDKPEKKGTLVKIILPILK